MNLHRSPQWAFIGVSLATVTLACSPAPFKSAETKHGQLTRRDGVWFLELRGTPEERGKAAGNLVGAQIRHLLPRYLASTFGAKDGLTAEHLDVIRRVTPHIPKTHMEQLRAISRAADVDFASALAINLAPEVFAPMLCSCFAATGTASADGKMLVGRNLDWFGGDVLKPFGLVVVEHPDAGDSFAHFTWPGLVGVVTGMNSRGLVAVDLVVLKQREESRAGLPVLFAVRSMLEQFGTARDAGGWLEQTKRTVPQNYLVADPDEAKVFETEPSRFRSRAMQNGLLAVGNLFNEDKGSHPRGRYTKMSTELATGPVGPPEAQALLKDVAMDSLNVQAVVFQPSELRVLFASTRRPAARGPWRTVELGSWLR